MLSFNIIEAACVDLSPCKFQVFHMHRTADIAILVGKKTIFGPLVAILGTKKFFGVLLSFNIIEAAYVDLSPCNFSSV